jgi:hypothetical protein
MVLKLKPLMMARYYWIGETTSLDTRATGCGRCDSKTEATEEANLSYKQQLKCTHERFSSKVGHTVTVKQGKTRQGKARQGKASKARQGKARDGSRNKLCGR